jgi:hypothetical protein
VLSQPGIKVFNSLPADRRGVRSSVQDDPNLSPELGQPFSVSFVLFLFVFSFLLLSFLLYFILLLFALVLLLFTKRPAMATTGCMS